MPESWGAGRTTRPQGPLPPSVLQPLHAPQVHPLNFRSRESASAAAERAQPSSHRNNVSAARVLKCLQMSNTTA